MTTALELAQTAAVEMGLVSPASIYATSELIPQQLGALLNATGETLVKRRVWRRLFREALITSVAGQAAYTLPADFARPISQTEWDSINRWPLSGPASSQQWQALKSGVLAHGPRERFRLVGNTLELWPAPASAGLTFSYYYVSKWWALTEGEQAKLKCTADNDTTIFDDRLMVSGMKLRFYQAKQFDSAAFAAEFQSNLDDALAQDSGGSVLSMARQPAIPLITVDNLPEGNW